MYQRALSKAKEYERRVCKGKKRLENRSTGPQSFGFPISGTSEYRLLRRTNRSTYSVSALNEDDPDGESSAMADTEGWMKPRP